MKEINLNYVESLGNCNTEVQPYKDVHGEGDEITEEFVNEYYYYPWTWLARIYLEEKEKEEFLKERATLITEYRINVYGMTNIKDKNPFRKQLMIDIGILFVRIWNNLSIKDGSPLEVK